MHRYFLIIIYISMSLLAAKTFTVNNSRQLYQAIESNNKDVEIILKPGVYDLISKPVTDSTLGNAVNPDTMITVSTGLHIVNKTISLTGDNRSKVIIKTHAGYGIFIERCPKVIIKDITISGGSRDQDGNATSGAVVVKHSEVTITGCIIEHNQGDFSKTVAGIIGIAGREGSKLTIDHNIIRDNSWDGIALYRGANATISNNLVYNGRGAGIGITWDAKADVRRNVIHHYWKGIGTFGTSYAIVENNLVRDVRGWGIIASGKSHLDCFYNEVRRCGNVGIALWDETASIGISSNVICQSGTDKQWVAPLVGIWLNAPDSLVHITNNLFWGNKQANIGVGYTEPGRDGSDFTFTRKVERFNNYTFYPTKTLNDVNYYTTAYREPGYSSIAQMISNPRVGIFAVIPVDKPWDWDPDKTPFDILEK